MLMMGVNVDVISDSGSSCCKSVGTDLSMLDIDDFISEISQLKKEVALLEEKLRERGDQLKREELEKVSCPSSVCVTDGTSRESQYSVWSSRDQPSPQRLVDKLSKERSRDTQDSELSLTLLCYTDSNPTDAQESVCESHQAFQDGSGLSLHSSTDQTSTQSLGSVCNGEEQQILQTPVMMCSVKLVDPEDMRAEIKAEGEQYYEDDYFIPSDENSSSASDGETDSTSAQRLTAQSHSCITSETSVTSQGHTIPKLFTCGACGSRFSTVQEKRHHAKVHRVKKDFHCEQCGKVYSSYSSSYMKVHMKMHSEKSFHCSVCGKFFHTKGNLVVHERIHTGEKPYRCPHCEKTFTYSSSLKTHVRLHTNERPYQCSHCERNFTQSSNLIAHQKIHSEEKPHQCSHCSKCYRRKSELKSHERIHSGEKPYLCSHCGKRFSSRATFRIHLRVHTGERPYHCTVCGKSFSQHISCVMHQRIHTGEKPYYCSTCGKRFSRQSDFVKHQRIHTREKHKKRDPGHASPNGKIKKWH